MALADDENLALRSVALQNAQAILAARRRAEEDLTRAHEELEKKSDELAHSLAVMRATLESTTDAILVTDGQRRVTGCNEKFLEMWDAPADVMQSRDHVRLLEFNSQKFHKPQEFLDRIDRIYAASPQESYDLLELADGRSIERFSRTQLIERANVGRVWSFRDITDRLRDEKKLRLRERELQMVMDHVPVLIARCDTQWNFRFANRGYAERFGLQPEEVVGKSMAEIIGPEACEVIRPYVERALAGEPVEFECEVPYQRIGPRFMRIAYEPERDGGGQIQGWVSVINDVTERRQAERTKIILGAIVESSQDAIVGKTLEGQILSWNAGAQQVFGYHESEVVGRSILLLIPPDRHDEEASILARLRRGERIEHYETIRLTKDGRRIDVSLCVSPLRDSSGTITGASKIARDISARKRSERTAKFLSEAGAHLMEISDAASTLERIASAAVPLFADWCAADLLDADGVVRRVALAHENPEKLALAQSLSQRYPAAHSDARGLYHVLRTGKSEFVPTITDAALVAHARDPEHLRTIRSLGLVSYLCVPLKSRGKAVGALAFATADSGRSYERADLTAAEDLAHRVVLALENANLVNALKLSDQRKDEFLAMLAHELRNPLAPIRNSVQILQATGAPIPELQWACNIIDRQVNQMNRLVDDLLDVSRISTGKIELRRERVELAAVLRDAIDGSRPLIEAMRHQLDVSIPQERIDLDADPIRLSQALLNLLNNAAKYTNAGGHLTLRAERQADHAIVRVKDDGVGIPASKLSSVFEMFTQLDRSLERSQGGLGIGLTLVRRIIEMHGGTVIASSQGLGKGSEFIVTLPLAGSVPEGADERRSEPADRSPKKRILVVDDNQDAANSLCMLLRLLGNEVALAHDGLAAVEMAADFSPEIILLDIGLPKLNGYDTARRIRSQQSRSEPVIIAMTGWGQDEDRARSKDAGFDHHLTKPLDFKVLKELLAES